MIPNPAEVRIVLDPVFPKSLAAGSGYDLLRKIEVGGSHLVS